MIVKFRVSAGLLPGIKFSIFIKQGREKFGSLPVFELWHYILYSFTVNGNLIARIHVFTLINFRLINAILNYLSKCHFIMIIFWVVVYWNCPFNEVTNKNC